MVLVGRKLDIVYRIIFSIGNFLSRSPRFDQEKITLDDVMTR